MTFGDNALAQIVDPVKMGWIGVAREKTVKHHHADIVVLNFVQTAFQFCRIGKFIKTAVITGAQ